MKSLLCLTLILVFSITVQAQDKLKGILPLMNGKVTYTSVIQVDSVPAEEIYNRAKLWLSNNFEYIKLDDKDKIMSRGYIKYGNFKILLTLTIKIKDGRYKYELTDFKWVDYGNGYMQEYDLEKPHRSVTNRYDYRYIDTHVNDLITLLKNAISTKPDNDQW